ncbi:hypothetical protein [Spirochaeta thermophila]|uniref:FecR protein domain-containing protein n=1 Tax=Winmispira thermophila (strain ATCC 49972 / DSM 6192 / RI 19.B1) TaxID=665571 RepID=E0RPB2_WINT6|nr:hypothetical protein [Spirochaeta thermophila]ADN01306.1 hypothetical protein STHERM_c03330 [Spirochaeta thermophila DSM 6192]
MRSRILCVLFVHLMAMVLQAEAAVGVILYAEGGTFSLYRGQDALRFDVGRNPVVGLAVRSGDLFQTDAESVLEVQVLGSQVMVKVGRNTTCEIRAEGEGVRLRVAYGTVRVRTGAEAVPVVVEGRGARADFSEGDVVYRFVSSSEGMRITTTSVEVRAGSVRVVPLAEGRTGEEVRVGPGERVEVAEEVDERGRIGITATKGRATVGGLPSLTFVHEPLSPDLIARLFPHLETEGGAVQGSVVQREGRAIQSVSLDAAQESRMLTASDQVDIEAGLLEARRQRAWGGALFLSGMFFTGLGVFVGYGEDVASPYWPYQDRPDLALSLFSVGGVAIVSGIVSYIAGSSVSY